MKILQIAPLWESVPPPAYGGTEAVVHLLVEELVKGGHDVTLCASGDSQTSANLQSCYPTSLRTANHLENRSVYSWQHSALALRDAAQYDIIHNHAGEEVMALSHLVADVPMLTTMHCLVTIDTQFVWDYYAGHYNTISWSQQRQMPKVGGRFAGVAYNGIDVASFPYQEDKEDYLLFLGRISPEKGPHLAVEAARQNGRRLVMAGKVDQADVDFYAEVVEPLIDGERVVYVGEADARMKRDLYRRASCVLMPLTWEEPFGLVMAEALACGTPVIAFNRGAAPEILRDGWTGFLVDTTEEMAAAIERVPEIRPADCRDHVEKRFDAPVMADAYLRLYDGILSRTPVAASENPALAEKVPSTYLA